MGIERSKNKTNYIVPVSRYFHRRMTTKEKKLFWSKTNVLGHKIIISRTSKYSMLKHSVWIKQERVV